MKILNMTENKYICNCKKYNLFEKDYIYWENRETTTDELDVIEFIKSPSIRKFVESKLEEQINGY